MDSVVIRFRLRNETKGALRYQEVDDRGNELTIGNGARIGTLYIRKEGVDSTPKEVHITLSVVEE